MFDVVSAIVLSVFIICVSSLLGYVVYSENYKETHTTKVSWSIPK